jgi:putative ABC transport system permease protein
MFSRRVPLAWRSITHDKKRMVLAIAGIMFSSVLMFMQMGFLNAVVDAQIKLVRWFNADLIITNSSKHHLGIHESFPYRRLEQALSVNGVAAALPVYIESQLSFWRNPQTHQSRPIRVVGLPIQDSVLLPQFMVLPPDLQEADSVLADRRSRRFFGPLTMGVQTELAGRRVHIAGTFSLGTDFESDGTVIMSDTNFLRYFPERRTAGPAIGRAEFGLLRVAPGQPVAEVREALQKALPPDVHIWTKPELIEQESRFWLVYTPIGFIFKLGLAIGFIVGVVICSQILYTSVVDRMPLFGTLKAIGYTNTYLIRLVTHEALLLSLLAFIPSAFIAWGLYNLLVSAVNFEMVLTFPRIFVVFAFTVGMSILAALVAIRKALTADPAEVFK